MEWCTVVHRLPYNFSRVTQSKILNRAVLVSDGRKYIMGLANNLKLKPNTRALAVTVSEPVLIGFYHPWSNTVNSPRGFNFQVYIIKTKE